MILEISIPQWKCSNLSLKFIKKQTNKKQKQKQKQQKQNKPARIEHVYIIKSQFQSKMYWFIASQ